MNTEHITVQDELKTLFNEMNIVGIKDEMRDYIIAELGSQVVERLLISIVKELPENRVKAFLEFIEKGASEDSLYVYLTSIYPKADELVLKTTKEVIDEFKQGLDQ